MDRPEVDRSDEIVGAFVRQIREEQGHRQDYFARMLSDRLRWTATTVCKIEAGHRSVKAWELLVLLDEFRPGLSPRDAIPELSDYVATRQSGWQGPDRPLDSERRAASRLGVSQQRLTEMAEQRWGHPFSAERMRRRIERSVSGRGSVAWIVREMIEELRPLST